MGCRREIGSPEDWSGCMRIITGTARGMKLKTPKGMETRPTADRIKESLFYILGTRVYGTRVLDVFAGTGNLGLEALSRGAEHAVFIDRTTAALVKENAEHTHLSDRAEIYRGDSAAILGRLARDGREFDLVFCDPPYHKGLWEKVLTMLDTMPLLSEKALVVVEHGRDENELPVLLRLERVRNETYGRTTQLSFFELKNGEENI